MAYRIPAVVCLFAVAALALGGCDAFDRAIGKDKVVPDEFAVTPGAPLALPPDYALRPPRLGEQRPQEETPTDQAKEAVFRAGDTGNGELPPAADNRSPGEGELLQEAGAADVPSNIRQLVNSDADTGQLETSFVDKLAFWRDDKKPAPSDAVINPVAEEARLKTEETVQKNPAAAADANAFAAAPTIGRTGDSSGSSGSGWFGWLGKLF